MEARPHEAPLKVCRRCSAASRTDAEACPSCGTPYRRRLWRWWLAIPIVAVAFAAGYFGWSAIRDDEAAEPFGLTIREARNITTGASAAKLKHVLDGQRPGRVKRSSGGGSQLTCRVYRLVDREDTFWEFCVLNGRLEISKPLQAEPRA